MKAGMSGSAAGLSGPLALVLLLPMEAGVPIAGSSVFLQLHLVLGLLLGPLADRAFDQAKGPALSGLATPEPPAPPAPAHPMPAS